MAVGYPLGILSVCLFILATLYTNTIVKPWIIFPNSLSKHSSSGGHLIFSVPFDSIHEQRAPAKSSHRLFHIPSQNLVLSISTTTDYPGLFMHSILASRRSQQTSSNKTVSRSFVSLKSLPSSLAIHPFPLSGDMETSALNESKTCIALVTQDLTVQLFCGMFSDTFSSDNFPITSLWETQLPLKDLHSNEDSRSYEISAEIQFLHRPQLREKSLHKCLAVAIMCGDFGMNPGVFLLNAESGSIVWSHDSDELIRQRQRMVEHFQELEKMRTLLDPHISKRSNALERARLSEKLNLWQPVHSHAARTSDHSNHQKLYRSSILEQLPYAWRSFVTIRTAHFSMNAPNESLSNQASPVPNVLVVGTKNGFEVLDIHSGMSVTHIHTSRNAHSTTLARPRFEDSGIPVLMTISIGNPCAFIVSHCERCTPVYTHTIPCQRGVQGRDDDEEFDSSEEEETFPNESKYSGSEESGGLQTPETSLRSTPPILFRLGSDISSPIFALVMFSTGQLVCFNINTGRSLWISASDDQLSWDTTFEPFPVIILSDTHSTIDSSNAETTVDEREWLAGMSKGGSVAIVRTARALAIFRLRDGFLLGFAEAEVDEIEWTPPLILDLDGDEYIDHAVVLLRGGEQLLGLAISVESSVTIETLTFIDDPNWKLSETDRVVFQISRAMLLKIYIILGTISAICFVFITTWTRDTSKLKTKQSIHLKSI